MSGMDTEQQQEQQVSLDPEILIEVQAEQIRGLTDQNVQLGAYIRQLKREIESLRADEQKMEAV